MKKLFLLPALALLPCLAMAQTDTLKTGTAPLIATSKATEQYASILPRNKFMSSRITLLVEGMPEASTYDKELLDDRRQPMVFDNVVDALNYMARQGWLYVNTYADDHGIHYLLRRPIVK
ncbi:hypothetical protein [Mucilaginibacter psychrotolerans]|uniref:Uncharacterized protein n=1 Tax=Mucilaginibacter psychrotolerans TaxID=1524096 RepID=A0A4Y8S7E6_9SPHI|nr:hypothetical protein [Mucilaginibacter psychrotolerans]TFF34304.1 hypothetical protein E2R66_22480 [Mucilaginibacter psychrotolerans]